MEMKFLHYFSVVIFGLLFAAGASANDVENVNPSCKLEPEANCSWSELRKLKAPGIDLHESAFMAVRFDGADLSGANLEFCHMHLANLSDANLSRANLSNSHLHAANLTGANLQGANLEGVNFLDAALERANFKGANINRVIWTAAKLSGATWVDGRVCAPGSIGECR